MNLKWLSCSLRNNLNYKKLGFRFRKTLRRLSMMKFKTLLLALKEQLCTNMTLKLAKERLFGSLIPVLWFVLLLLLGSLGFLCVLSYLDSTSQYTLERHISLQ